MVLAYIILLPNSLGGGRVRVRITFTGNVIASGVTLIFFFREQFVRQLQSISKTGRNSCLYKELQQNTILLYIMQFLLCPIQYEGKTVLSYPPAYNLVKMKC